MPESLGGRFYVEPATDSSGAWAAVVQKDETQPPKPQAEGIKGSRLSTTSQEEQIWENSTNAIDMLAVQ